MGSPEDRERKRRRIRSHIAKDLEKKQFRQRVKESKKNKAVDTTKLTHADLVKLINEKDDDGIPD